ncbi:hypothetical protein [Lacrimispora xylanisolvens]|uniref:hypothetical protein n=1 Tax=Lacrimispora xylanisolvens TaxID=384636 RepID=UPI002402917F
MAGALKHKQRSHRSFYENRKVLGSVATATACRSNSRNMVRQATGVNWLERFKQIFRSQKGDK